jgi:hypothetical protein
MLASLVADPLAQTSSAARWFCRDYSLTVFQSQRCVQCYFFVHSLKLARGLRGPRSFELRLGMSSQAAHAIS